MLWIYGRIWHQHVPALVTVLFFSTWHWLSWRREASTVHILTPSRIRDWRPSNPKLNDHVIWPSTQIWLVCLSHSCLLSYSYGAYKNKTKFTLRFWAMVRVSRVMIEVSWLPDSVWPKNWLKSRKELRNE